MMRRVLRRLRAGSQEAIGSHRRGLEGLDGSAAVVLTYHRVVPRDEAERLAIEPGMFVTPETFARQLDWISSSLRPLPLDEITTRLAEGRALPVGACGLSFDDGWRDNHRHALPALQARSVPATVFLVTGRVGTRGAFWPDEVCRRMAGQSAGQRRDLVRSLAIPEDPDPTQAVLGWLKTLSTRELAGALDRVRKETPDPGETERELLDWDEVDEMARAGVAFESHGASHAILTHVDDASLDHELRVSGAALRDRGLGAGALFAYPSGAFDARVAQHARSAGYRTAFTTRRCWLRADDDPMAHGRIGLHDDVSSTRSEFRRQLVQGARG